MPHIRVRGVEAKVVQRLSENAHAELANLIKTSPENFTFEWVQTQFFSQGRTGGEYPFVEVDWFDRGTEAKKSVATYLTNELRRLGCTGDIAVVFRPLEPKDYFENGQHF